MDKLNQRDYVIKDGVLVGDWEGLYQSFDDPWSQSKPNSLQSTKRDIVLSWCRRLKSQYQSNRTIEIGCGLGHLTSALTFEGFDAVGVDVSSNAIRRARELHPKSRFVHGAFEDLNIYEKFEPDIFILAEISWYVLEHLSTFLTYLRKSHSNARHIFLVHLLATYPKGKQLYGREYFTNLDEMKNFFNLSYIESGTICSSNENDEDATATFFLGKVV